MSHQDRLFATISRHEAKAFRHGVVAGTAGAALAAGAVIANGWLRVVLAFLAAFVWTNVIYVARRLGR